MLHSFRWSCSYEHRFLKHLSGTTLLPHLSTPCQQRQAAPRIREQTRCWSLADAAPCYTDLKMWPCSVGRQPATVVTLGHHASVLAPVLACSHVVLTIHTCIPAAPDGSPPLSSSSGSVPDYVGNDLGRALSTPERMRPDHAWCGPGSLFRNLGLMLRLSPGCMQA